MFAPLGLSYLVTLLASLAVSLTVTPVLASFLLPQAKFLEHAHDPLLLRWLSASTSVFCTSRCVMPASCWP